MDQKLTSIKIQRGVDGLLNLVDTQIIIIMRRKGPRGEETLRTLAPDNSTPLLRDSTPSPNNARSPSKSFNSPADKVVYMATMQRCHKFSQLRKTIYPQGIKRMVRDLQLFPLHNEPQRMKLVSLVWEAASVKNKLPVVKTHNVTRILRELLDTAQTPGEKQRSIYSEIVGIYTFEGIPSPGAVCLKNLSMELVRYLDLVASRSKEDRGLSARNYSSSRLPSSFSKHPSDQTLTPNNQAHTPKCPKQLKPQVLPVKSARTASRSRECLFELRVQINGELSEILVYPGEEASTVVGRLRRGRELSCLMSREIEEMVQEFIEEHPQ